MSAARQPAIRRTLACVVLAMLPLYVVGTSGCWKSSTSAKTDLEKLKEKKPEPPFENLRVFTEPNERSSFDEKAKDTERIILATKPGHWTGALVQARANLYDFDGLLATTPLDSQQRPVDLERSPFWVKVDRDVTLPKSQRKTLETLFFAPGPPPMRWQRRRPGSTTSWLAVPADKKSSACRKWSLICRATSTSWSCWRLNPRGIHF